jgi:hypothetical protein
MIKIIDNIMKFVKNNAVAMDRGLNRMAIDIERLSKEQVPVDKGQLRSSGNHSRVGIMKYKVTYNKVYARFQEFGGDDSRTVKNYKYPGKKKGFLRDPGRIIAKQAFSYFKQEARTVTV